MKKILLSLTITLLFLFNLNVFAEETEETKTQKEITYDENTSTKMMTDKMIQNHISEIGYRLLNANRIEARMVFIYKDKDVKIEGEPGLTKRQIIVYDKTINHTSNDDEIAAYLARQICKSAESYNGMFNGTLTSVQIKSAPKKYEIFFDKRAVDFLVTANFNPIGLITFLHKSEPQRRFDKFSTHNLTSKRLAHIYEYIYTKYPMYLLKNTYITDETYQNFLLNSIENRKKLYKKIETKSKKKVDYE